VASQKVAELLLRLALDLSAAADADEDTSSIFEICDGANDVTAVVGLAGFSFLQSSGLLTALAGEVQDGEEAEGREAALLGLKQLCAAVGRACEPYLLPLLPLLLERLADKAPAVREAAGEAAQALAGALCPQAVRLALPSEWLSVGF
jgi:elongation factor 3